jgi:hypothetical protein
MGEFCPFPGTQDGHAEFALHRDNLAGFGSLISDGNSIILLGSIV